MNCMRRVPLYDGVRDGRQKCQLNGFQVNGRMVCEEWKSDDLGGFVGAISVSGITTQKKK